MTEFELLEKAVGIAVTAHRGQKDKYGAPYILHVLRLTARVETVKEKIVAVLHDVVEDTDWTFERLGAEGFSEELIQAIDALTKREGEDYEDFVKRSASNPLACQVKIADLEDNMDVRRMENVSEQEVKRLRKYLKAWKHIRGTFG